MISGNAALACLGRKGNDPAGDGGDGLAALAVLEEAFEADGLAVGALVGAQLYPVGAVRIVAEEGVAAVRRQGGDAGGAAARHGAVENDRRRGRRPEERDDQAEAESARPEMDVKHRCSWRRGRAWGDWPNGVVRRA